MTHPPDGQLELLQCDPMTGPPAHSSRAGGGFVIRTGACASVNPVRAWREKECRISGGRQANCMNLAMNATPLNPISQDHYLNSSPFSHNVQNPIIVASSRCVFYSAILRSSIIGSILFNYRRLQATLQNPSPLLVWSNPVANPVIWFGPTVFVLRLAWQPAVGANWNWNFGNEFSVFFLFFRAVV